MIVNLDERVTYLLIGCLIGFVLGYFTRYLQKIEKKIEIVDDKLSTDAPRDEGGFMRKPIVADIAIVLVVVLTAYAAFVSQLAVNEVKADNEQDERQDAVIAAVLQCNTEITEATIVALNERTTFSAENNQANVDLVKAQLEFLTLGLTSEPPLTPEQFEGVLQNYISSANSFTEVADQQKGKALAFEYPEKGALQACIDRKVPSNE